MTMSLWTSQAPGERTLILKDANPVGASKDYLLTRTGRSSRQEVFHAQQHLGGRRMGLEIERIYSDSLTGTDEIAIVVVTPSTYR